MGLMRDQSAPSSDLPALTDPEVRSILKSQTSLEKSYTRRATVRRDGVFHAMVYHADRFINIKQKHQNFLNNWKDNVSLEKAANNANLTVEQARRFLARKDVRAWLDDLRREAAIKQEWDRPGKWYAKGQEMLAQPVVPDHHIKIWQEFGDRAVPKPSRNAPSEARPTITININPNAVDKAFERQAAIEAQISKEAA